MHMSNDITAVYYTAEVAPSSFTATTMTKLLESLDGIPLVVIKLEDPSLRSHFQIYRQALEGAKQAKTTYIALCEDDELYSPAHFQYRPRKTPFAYNLAYWGVYTWQDPPMYNYKGRKNLGNLICDRVAFIQAMEERFAKYPDPQGHHLKDIWAEPGKYERQLGVPVQETEDFYTNPPNIKFSHETELSFAGLGKRKKAGTMRAFDIPYWGHVNNIRSIYE